MTSGESRGGRGLCTVAGESFSSRARPFRRGKQFPAAGQRFSSREVISRREKQFPVARWSFSSREIISRREKLSLPTRRSADRPLRSPIAAACLWALRRPHNRYGRGQVERRRAHTLRGVAALTNRGTPVPACCEHTSCCSTRSINGHGVLNHALSNQDQ